MFFSEYGTEGGRPTRTSRGSPPGPALSLCLGHPVVPDDDSRVESGQAPRRDRVFESHRFRFKLPGSFVSLERVIADARYGGEALVDAIRWWEMR